MKPYYESEQATIWCADARLVLPTLKAESVDLVVTDPPYGVEWQSSWRNEGFGRIDGDGTEAVALVAAVSSEIVRLIRPRRHVYTFGLAIVDPMLPATAELVWDKERIGMGNLSQVWGPSHEPIYFHVRASDRKDGERGRGNLAARLRRGSVLRVPRLNAVQVKRHPTEKPVALLRQLVESSSAFGEAVLDPFAGVGSTLVAAILEGRRALGVEIEEKYARIAVERVIEAERVSAEMRAA